MSQQINLLLPELKKHFDWLALPVVAVTSACLIGLTLIWSGAAAMRAQVLQTEEAGLSQNVQQTQQQILLLTNILAERKENPQLAAEVESLRLSILQREQAIGSIGKLGSDAPGYATRMQGFARQLQDGVWLTGFSFLGEDVEIRGRLTDASLLPAYIGRLNGESAFAGRQFSALAMKQVDAKQDKPAAGDTAGTTSASNEKTKPLPRYVEFSLTSERLEMKGKPE